MQLRIARLTDPDTPTELKPSVMPIISITTTLSAGEYNPIGGATSDTTKHKQLFLAPASTGPKVIIWDPELTLTVPDKVWLSTGLRAVDHCVETICSSNPKAAGTVYSTKGLRLLIPALLRTKQDPTDLAARLDAQKGSAESMKAFLLEGVRVGKSTVYTLVIDADVFVSCETKLEINADVALECRRIAWNRPSARPIWCSSRW